MGWGEGLGKISDSGTTGGLNGMGAVALLMDIKLCCVKQS